MHTEHIYVLSSRYNALVWPQGVRLRVGDMNKYCRSCCCNETLSHRVQETRLGGKYEPKLRQASSTWRLLVRFVMDGSWAKVRRVHGTRKRLMSATFCCIFKPLDHLLVGTGLASHAWLPCTYFMAKTTMARPSSRQRHNNAPQVTRWMLVVEALIRDGGEMRR